MLGPLPRLHQVVLVLASVIVFVGLGVWVGAHPQIPVVVSVGAMLGAALAMAASWLLLHQPHQHQRRLAQRAHSRRRGH